jgi:hypothetical protein
MVSETSQEGRTGLRVPPQNSPPTRLSTNFLGSILFWIVSWAMMSCLNEDGILSQRSLSDLLSHMQVEETPGPPCCPNRTVILPSHGSYNKYEVCPAESRNQYRRFTSSWPSLKCCILDTGSRILTLGYWQPTTTD